MMAKKKQQLTDKVRVLVPLSDSDGISAIEPGEYPRTRLKHISDESLIALRDKLFVTFVDNED